MYVHDAREVLANDFDFRAGVFVGPVYCHSLPVCPVQVVADHRQTIRVGNMAHQSTTVVAMEISTFD